MKLIRRLCSGQLHNNIPAILADEVLVGPDVVVDAVVVLVELVLEVLTSWVFQELLRHKASSPRLKRKKWNSNVRHNYIFDITIYIIKRC